MASSLKTWGAPLGLRGPGNEFVPREPAEVGDMVVAAIRADQFLLVTDPLILDRMRRRAADPDKFLAKMLTTIEGGAYADFST